MAEPAVDCVLDIGAELSECPVWCGRSQRLYWVDIPKGTLNHLDPATGRNDSWEMGEPIGSSSALGIGLLALGDTKYKTESGLFQRMIAATQVVRFDFRDAFALAREFHG